MFDPILLLDFNDISAPSIPLPDNYEDFLRPVFITQEYYDKLSKEEKSYYEKKLRSDE